MKVKVREQVKSLLATQGMTITDLAPLLAEATGDYYTPASLTAKLQRGSLSYNEMLEICEILGYDIEFKIRD